MSSEGKWWLKAFLPYPPPVHTPVSGTVTSIENIMTPCGTPLRSDNSHGFGRRTRKPTAKASVVWNGNRRLSRKQTCPRKNITPEEILLHAVEAGIVGLGGATFPAHAKLCVQPEIKSTHPIINGCECEPYLMCDDALMRNCAPA